MTISTTTIKNSYNGNGSTSAFNYTFKISAESEMQVIIRSAAGTETVKTLTTHYTITGVGNAGGGAVTFTAGNIPVTGETVILRRVTAQTQAMDLIDNDPMSADTIENAHDKSIAIAQELQEQIDRSIKLSRTNTMTSTEFTVDAASRANKILAFDSAGEISVTQELGTYKGTDATVTTEAYNVRDLIKSTTAAQLNNVYICTADSVIGDLLTDTDHFELLVDAVSAATSATNAAASEAAAASSATDAQTAQTAAETAETNASKLQRPMLQQVKLMLLQVKLLLQLVKLMLQQVRLMLQLLKVMLQHLLQLQLLKHLMLVHQQVMLQHQKVMLQQVQVMQQHLKVTQRLQRQMQQLLKQMLQHLRLMQTMLKTAAQAAQAAAELAYDNFDDTYLGPKASDPTLDNDGDALLMEHYILIQYKQCN
jgi:hypothetical protein